jgi:hypothetical protein
MNGITLPISRYDTLRPLGIYFRPLANNICGFIYHKQSSISFKINLGHCSPSNSKQNETRLGAIYS